MILADLSGALFPLRLGTSTVDEDNEADYVVDTLARALSALQDQVRLEPGHHRSTLRQAADRN